MLNRALSVTAAKIVISTHGEAMYEHNKHSIVLTCALNQISTFDVPFLLQIQQKKNAKTQLSIVTKSHHAFKFL